MRTEAQLANEIIHLANEYHSERITLKSEGSTIFSRENEITVRRKADFIKFVCMKNGEIMDWELNVHQSTRSETIAHTILALEGFRLRAEPA